MVFLAAAYTDVFQLQILQNENKIGVYLKPMENSVIHISVLIQPG